MTFETFYHINPVNSPKRSKQDAENLWNFIIKSGISASELIEKYRIKIDYLKNLNRNTDPSGQKFQRNLPTPEQWLDSKGWQEDLSKLEQENPLDEYLYGWYKKGKRDGKK